MTSSESDRNTSPMGTGERSPEDLYVITENGEQCFLWRSNQLTYIAQDRHELPAILATKFGHLATRLDLSYNSLTSFKNINLFTNLNELILDNNLLEDYQLEFTLNLRLKTLSLNKNKLANLYKLVNSIKVCLPNLEYLSLIGNPLCPGPLMRTLDNNSNKTSTTTTTEGKGAANIDELVLESSSGGGGVSSIINQLGTTTTTTTTTTCDNSSSEFSQQKYRHFIIYHLPNLRFLDSSPITPSERDEALRRCFWMSQATLSQLNEPSTRPLKTSSVRHHSPLTACQLRNHSENSASSAAGDDHDDQATVDGQFRLTIMSGNGDSSSSNNRANDTGEHDEQQPKAVFSRLAYKYTGKNSEGNRFIRNQDL